MQLHEMRSTMDLHETRSTHSEIIDPHEPMEKRFPPLSRNRHLSECDEGLRHEGHQPDNRRSTFYFQALENEECLLSDSFSTESLSSVNGSTNA